MVSQYPSVLTFLAQIERRFLDCLAPKICLQCGSLNAWVCLNCLESLGLPHFKPVRSDSFYIYPFGNTLVKEILHQLKYFGLYEIATDLCQYLLIHYQKEAVWSDLGIKTSGGRGLMVPVPTSKDRLKKRGYNQAEVIARAFSLWLGMPVGQMLGKRSGASLVGKDKEERATIAGKFYWRIKIQDLPSPDFILLVDDVITTGSTMRACLEILQNKFPATKVLGIAVAHEL